MALMMCWAKVACAIIASKHTFIDIFVKTFLIQIYYLKPEIMNNAHLSDLSHFLKLLGPVLTVIAEFKEVCSYLKSNFHWVTFMSLFVEIYYGDNFQDCKWH